MKKTLQSFTRRHRALTAIASATTDVAAGCGDTGTATEQFEQPAGTAAVPDPIEIPELFARFSVRLPPWQAATMPPTVTAVTLPPATVCVNVKPFVWHAATAALPPWRVPPVVPSAAAAA